MADLTFDASAIRSKGGLKWAYKRVASDGADLGTPDTWHDGVYRQKSTFEFSQPLDDIIAEDGNVVASEQGDLKTELVITSLQDDAVTETFLKDETSDAYFAIFMNAGLGAAGKTKERFIAISKIQRSYKVDAPGRKPDITINPQLNSASVTPATVPTWAKLAASGYVVSANGYYIVKETT